MFNLYKTGSVKTTSCSFFSCTCLSLSSTLPPFQAPFYLWMVSSCSLTMCASCWNIEPSSTMVLSIFCMVSARLWMYESCYGTASKISKRATLDIWSHIHQIPQSNISTQFTVDTFLAYSSKDATLQNQLTSKINNNWLSFPSLCTGKLNAHTPLHLSDFDKHTPTVYLLINKLELQGIALRVHIDGYIPQTPGLILHQDRALWRDTTSKTCTHVQQAQTEILNGRGGKSRKNSGHIQ